MSGEKEAIVQAGTELATDDEKLGQDLLRRDISCEKWREYIFGGVVYRIDKPRKFYYREGGTTHRVLDDKGIVHIVPAPGMFGCAIRYEPENPAKPVNF